MHTQHPNYHQPGYYNQPPQQPIYGQQQREVRKEKGFCRRFLDCLCCLCLLDMCCNTCCWWNTWTNAPCAPHCLLRPQFFFYWTKRMQFGIAAQERKKWHTHTFGTFPTLFTMSGRLLQWVKKTGFSFCFDEWGKKGEEVLEPRCIQVWYTLSPNHHHYLLFIYIYLVIRINAIKFILKHFFTSS